MDTKTGFKPFPIKWAVICAAIALSGCQTDRAMVKPTENSFSRIVAHQSTTEKTQPKDQIELAGQSIKNPESGINRRYDRRMQMAMMNQSLKIELFEANLDYKTSSYTGHKIYCDSLIAIGNYKEARTCLDILDEQIETGNARGDFDQSFRLFGEPPNSSYDFHRSFTDSSIASFHFILRNYQAAYDMMKKSVEASLKSDYGFTMPQAIEILAVSYIRLYGVEASQDKAKEYIQQIKKFKFPTLFGIQLMDPKKYINESTIRIHFALGNYAEALEIIKDTPDFVDITNIDKITNSVNLLHALLDPIGGGVALIGGLVSQEATKERYKNEIAGLEASEKMSNLFLQAKIRFELEDYIGSRTAYDAFIAWENSDWLHDMKFTALHDRSKIAAYEGDTEYSSQLLRQAIELIEKHRASIDTEADKIGFIADKQAVYGDLIRQLVRSGKYSEAFEYSERAKSRALVDMLASKSDFRVDGGSKAITSAVEAVPTLAGWVRTENAAKARSRSNDNIGLEDVRKNQPELASLVAVEIPNSNELQQLLPKNENVLEYFVSGDQVVAFHITGRNITARSIEVPKLQKLIRTYRTALDNPSDDSHLQIGKSLSEQLLQPMLVGVSGNRLTIVPHGELHYLPFAALPTNKGYLVEDYRLRTLPSVSVLKFLKNRTGTDSLMALGNPDLNDSNMDLPGTVREVNDIVSIVPKSEKYLGKEATESVVKTKAKHHSILHIASHGVFNPDQPLQSSLLLSQDHQNDGLLTVGELYSMELDADLVTLSACETGLGHINNGDDVVGLTRGFFYAGTSSVVSSLWQVDDEATALLMQRFYRYLKDNNKRDALRLAQLDIKRSYSDHPYFWAPFQLSGTIH